jgi:L-amino acid N-acyltransferase YncA
MHSRPEIHSAAADDLDWCCGVDPGVAREVIASKIAAGDILLACTDDGAVAGFLRLDWLWCKKPFLASIEIAAEHRGRGVGSALLQELERRLIELGYDRLISSTLPDNLPSRNWHRKRGFAECGILAGINAGGADEVFFVKELRAAAIAAQ